MLAHLISISGLPIENFIRKGEEDFKVLLKGKSLTGNQMLEAIVKYPKLLQRPIVVKGDQAIIARDVKELEVWLKDV